MYVTFPQSIPILYRPYLLGVKNQNFIAVSIKVFYNCLKTNQVFICGTKYPFLCIATTDSKHLPGNDLFELMSRHTVSENKYAPVTK